jgi:hypothetical protein
MQPQDVARVLSDPLAQELMQSSIPTLHHNWRALNVSHAPTWPESRPSLNQRTR